MMMIRPGPNQITCGWTRDRLPALAEPESAAAADCPLAPGERPLIAAHLKGCEGCRDHLESLRGALAALELAAADSPVDPRSPSLWPALEARIRASAEAQQRLQASQPAPQIRLVPGLAAAAAVLFALVAQPRLQAWRADSEARIAAAEVPLAVAVEKSLAARAELLMTFHPDDADEAAIGPESLAQSSAPPTPPPGRAADGAKEPAARRYDFDLERGVPMPRGAQTGAAY